MSGDSPDAGRAATVTVMATPPKQLPLTADEVAEGELLGRQWQKASKALDAAAKARDAWFVRMDRKYRGQFYDLPARLSKLAGASRWTYGRAVRDGRGVMDLNPDCPDEGGQTA